MPQDFILYFGDGSEYLGQIEDIPTAKADEVQAIAWNDPDKTNQGLGRVVLEQWDIYIFSDSIGWHGTNKYADLMTHLRKGIGPGGVRCVLSGLWMDKPEFDAIIRRAKNDPRLNVKSASDPIRENGAA